MHVYYIKNLARDLAYVFKIRDKVSQVLLRKHTKDIARFPRCPTTNLFFSQDFSNVARVPFLENSWWFLLQINLYQNNFCLPSF
jgi:hypothetical protein